MSSIADLKAKIETVNLIGKQNLEFLHCIELDENASTYDIMNSICKIPPLQYAESISGLMKGSLNDNTSNRIVLPENTEYTLNLPSCTKMESAFNNIVNLTKITFRNLNENKSFSIQRAFFGCRELEEIDFGIEHMLLNSFNSAFSNCYKLKRVIGCLDTYDCEESSITLVNVYELEEIRFVDETIHANFNIRNSAKLSAESVDSIINGLEIVGKATTITFNVAVTLTDEQKAAISDKGWTLVLY